MGLRFRKTISSGGVKTTLGKSSASVSTGTGGVRVSQSTSGRSRATVSVPGTGVSYTSQKGGKFGDIGVLILGVLIFVLIASCGHSSDDATVEPSPIPTPEPTVSLQTPSPTDNIVERSLVTEESPEPEPTPEPEPEPTPEPTPRQYTFILNTHTHKYHWPSCSSVKDIKPSNYQEFTGTIEELEAMGYQPCKRCG